MQFKGAMLGKEGQVFVVIQSKSSITKSNFESERVRKVYQGCLRNKPVVLMSQDSKGNPRYSGPIALVRELASLNPKEFNWKLYNFK